MCLLGKEVCAFLYTEDVKLNIKGKNRSISLFQNQSLLYYIFLETS